MTILNAAKQRDLSLKLWFCAPFLWNNYYNDEIEFLSIGKLYNEWWVGSIKIILTRSILIKDDSQVKTDDNRQNQSYYNLGPS